MKQKRMIRLYVDKLIRKAIAVLFYQLIILSTCHLINLSTCQFGYLYASPFLKLPTSARGVSLAGAYVAGDGLSVLEYNPSGILTHRGLNLEISHMIYFEDISINSFFAGYSGRNFGVAFGYKGYSIEDIARDVLGSERGKITHSESVITGAAALEIGRNFTAGLGIRSLSRNISESRAVGITTSLTGMLFDVGITMSKGADNYAVSLTNFGSDAKFDYTVAIPEVMPLTIMLGGRHEIRNVTGYWQVATVIGDKGIVTSTALEYDVTANFSMRGGMRYRESFDIFAGFGFKWSRFYLDYAISPHADLGLAHNISVGARF